MNPFRSLFLPHTHFQTSGANRKPGNGQICIRSSLTFDPTGAGVQLMLYSPRPPGGGSHRVCVGWRDGGSVGMSAGGGGTPALLAHLIIPRRRHARCPQIPRLAFLPEEDEYTTTSSISAQRRQARPLKLTPPLGSRARPRLIIRWTCSL